MAITANPFHPTTGELLPSYRDAYLRGDLSVKNTELVDDYLKANPSRGTEAFERFHLMQHAGHAVRPVGWLQHQFYLVRTEPARFRRRAGSLVLGAAMLSGAVFAASGPAISPASHLVTTPTVASINTADLASVELAPEAAASASAMTTVSGRILDENGQPLVGATILDKTNGRGVSTDANGNYALTVPRSQSVQLQFGYGGYQEKDVLVHGRSLQTVTLAPRPDQKKKRRWWLF